MSEEEKFFWVKQVATGYLLSCVAVAAVIFSEDRQCWSVRGRLQERGLSSLLAVCSLSVADFQNGVEKKTVL